MKKGTREQWDKLGLLCFEARNRIGEAWMASQIIPKNKTDKLRKAQKLVDEFRNEAENLMFVRDGIEDNTIFYRNMRKRS